MENENDSNVGGADSGIPASGDSAAQGDMSGQPSSNPVGTSGQQPSQEAVLREEVKRLNQALVEAKRSSNQSNKPKFDPETGQPIQPSQEEQIAQQYGTQLAAADGQLRRQLEDVFDLYVDGNSAGLPALPAAELALIRKNPWAFTSPDTFRTGDVEAAIREIDVFMARRVEQLGAQAPQVNPAEVNPNAGDTEDSSNQADNQDDWTMPLEELEKKVEKSRQKVQTK